MTTTGAPPPPARPHRRRARRRSSACSAASPPSSSSRCTRSCGRSTAPTSRRTRHLAPLPHRGAVGARRARRGRRRHRRGRRSRGRGPHREPQPPVGGRAVPGRGHRRRRDHPRRLLDGRPPDRAHGPAALRSARRRRAPATCSKASSPASAGTATPSGVPTVGGEVVFDDCYRDNPLVNVLCLGVLPGRAARARQGRGRRTTSRCCSARPPGRDGIGGASVLASAGFEEGSEAKRPSVQVGDPFEEKRLIEACLELLDAGLAVGVQDLGAAGISCAASETAAKTGAGMDVDVARVAKREPGMNPVEVMTSESQERMLAIVTPAEPRRGARALRAVGDPRHRSSGASPTPRASVSTTGCSTRSACPGANPAAPRGDDPPRAVVRPRARSPTSRSRASATVRCTDRPLVGRPPTSPTAQAADPAVALGGALPGRHRPLRASCSRCSPRPPSPTSRGCTASTTTSCSSTRWSAPGGDAAVLRLKGTRRALALTTDGKAPLLRARPRRGRPARGGRGGAQPRVRGRRRPARS